MYSSLQPAVALRQIKNRQKDRNDQRFVTFHLFDNVAHESVDGACFRHDVQGTANDHKEANNTGRAFDALWNRHQEIQDLRWFLGNEMERVRINNHTAAGCVLDADKFTSRYNIRSNGT